jgi:protein gp37
MMAENTRIEWADHTFNPWVGCTKVSPACDHCYAEGWAKRTGQPHLWQGDRRRTSAANWQQPLKWNRQAERDGCRFRVFCASLADVFDNQVPARWRHDLWHRIDQTPHLDWLLLTKRPQNVAKMLPDTATGVKPWGDGWPNVWLGTTVENQAEADRRIPHLLAVPAAVHFLSCEPLLGPVDLTTIYHDQTMTDALEGMSESNVIDAGDRYVAVNPVYRRHPRIDWVIAGGESGHGARPSHPAWFRSLRDQCAAAGVPFHFKQHGAWIGECQRDAAGDRVSGKYEGTGHDGLGGLHYWHSGKTDWSIRIGKTSAPDA